MESKVLSKDNNFSGKGVENGEQNWPDGSKYIGEFLDGQPNGQGTYFWPDGDKYVGQWVLGSRSGLGIHTRTNGSTYIGEFLDNKPNGHGTYITYYHYISG